MIQWFVERTQATEQWLFRLARGSQLRKNMLVGVFACVANTAVILVSYPIFLHYLGYESYGVWLVLATVLGFAQLGNLGIGEAVTKLVAEEWGRGETQGVGSYVAMSMLALSITGAVVILAILCFKDEIVAVFNLSAENFALASWLLPYISLLAAYMFLVQALNAALSGVGRMDLAFAAQSISRIVSLGWATALLYRGGGVESLLIGNAVSYFFLHIVSLLLIRRVVQVRIIRACNWDIRRLRTLLQFGGTVIAGSTMNLLLIPFNSLMVARYAGVSAIPVYDIAYKSAWQVRVLFHSGLRALLPEFSHLGAKITDRTSSRILDLQRKATRLTLLASIPTFGAVFILAAPMLKFWLGERYVNDLPTLMRIMLAGALINLLAVPAFYALMGSGRVRHCFVGQAIQAITNVVLIGAYLLFFKTVSIYAVAVSLLLAMCMSFAYLSWQGRKLHRIFSLSQSVVDHQGPHL